jgi:hypothetical protein
MKMEFATVVTITFVASTIAATREEAAEKIDNAIWHTDYDHGLGVNLELHHSARQRIEQVTHKHASHIVSQCGWPVDFNQNYVLNEKAEEQLVAAE